jgi:hypothetical protein
LNQVRTVLEQYSDLYAEIPQSIYAYFESLLEDKKPAVHIEIYGKSLARVKEFKAKLEKLGFFAHLNESGKSQSLSVSKLKSVAYWLNKMDEAGFGRNAGAVGLMVGYSLKDIINYVKRTREDQMRESLDHIRHLHGDSEHVR